MAQTGGASRSSGDLRAALRLVGEGAREGPFSILGPPVGGQFGLYACPCGCATPSAIGRVQSQIVARTDSSWS